MSRVFIAWSGNFGIASKLKDLIDDHPGYEAIVGGNLHTLNTIFVGGTIIEQMKQCDQAILLVQKNEAHGGLSPNVMFEWGYLIAKLSANKIHHYLINEPEIPSDLHGVWSYGISTADHTDDEIAQELCDKFFSSQRNSLNKNKMRVIMDRDETRSIIKKHIENPICSNYEMAQYVLCYMFSANIYMDTREEAFRDMELFYSQMGENAQQSQELLLAVRCAIITISFFRKIKYIGDEQFIDKDDFYTFRECYEDLMYQIEDLAESEVKKLLIVSVGDFVTYLYLLIINGRDIDDDKKRIYCSRLYEDSERTANDCFELEKMAPKLNSQLCWLIRSYMYRDMFCALDCVEKIEGVDTENRTEEQLDRLNKIKDCLYKSLEERKKLYNEYSVGNVNAAFLNNIEMEYFLALAEYRLYENDYRLRERYKEKLIRYVKNIDKMAAQKRVFTEKIRGYIEK